MRTEHESSSRDLRERMATLSLANDAGKLAEALGVAVRALAWYADERHWKEDDWGCLAVIDHPDYAEAGKKARAAIKRVERLTRPERVAKAVQRAQQGEN